MRMSFVKIIAGLMSMLALLASCRRDVKVHEPEPPVYGIQFVVPDNWPQPYYTFQNNPLSEEGFRLGRKLFFETRLSKDNTISCASCHQQFAAFSHSGHAVSHGINGLLGIRNSPVLINLNWHKAFFWDGGANHIEVQPLVPIANPVEMDETIANVITKLSADAAYRNMFKEAFGDTVITSQRMLRALAQFMGMLNSSNSKYDKVMRGEAGVAFTADEQAGLNLVRQKCTTCHTEPLFTDNTYRNIGLAVNPAVNDSGRAHITNLATDRYKFKVPTLRNIEVSSPYFHDGRANSLYQCLDMHITGNVNSPTLDPVFANGGIVLNAQEKQQVLSFLYTLTDHDFLSDPRFKSPN